MESRVLDSGGALGNSRGDLVGINTAIISRGAEGNQGIGNINLTVAVHISGRNKLCYSPDGKMAEKHIHRAIGFHDGTSFKHPPSTVKTEILDRLPWHRNGWSQGDIHLYRRAEVFD